MMDPQQVSNMAKPPMLAQGYQELAFHCKQLYPKTEPVIVPSGGTSDPLDYIHIYLNHAQPTHWHYVGFGLSDINNYSNQRREYERLRESNRELEKMIQPLPKVYPADFGESVISNGFGFEITFRVRCNSDSEPPMWPCRMMQDMAKYVFDYRNIFSVGDHLAWNSPLDSNCDAGDNDDNGTSKIEHLLMTLDPQLEVRNAALGPVKFIQMVGACNEELQAARKWNVGEILKFMQEREETGGPLLVTDMRRGGTIFELDPAKCELLEKGYRTTGSNMAQIGAKHKTSHVKPDWFVKVEQQMKAREEMGDEATQQQQQLRHDEELRETHISIEDSNDKQRMETDDYPVRTPSRMSLCSQAASESSLLIGNLEQLQNRSEKHYDNAYLLLSGESAQVLPVMLDGRLAHRRPFSFQSIKGDSTVTFVPEGCPNEALGSLILVNPEQPIVRKANWLQIFVPHELREQMSETIRSDSRPVPVNYSWPEHNLHITVVGEL